MSTTRYVLVVAGALAVAGAPLGARGETPATFERRCIPPERRCSSVVYGQYAPSSRLVSRAPHRSQCYAGFHHGLLGYRTGLLSANAASGLLVVGLLLLLWVLAAGLLMLVRGGRARLDLRTGAVLVLAAGASAIPLTTILPFIGAPPIHDITTDVDDPPRFDAVVAVRGGASNPLEYRGPDLAATQRAAYPDIQSLHLGGNPSDLADLALAVAEELGWQVVAVESFGSELRAISPNDPLPPMEPYRGVLIEATDTTYWFGFKDDVAVRLRSPYGAVGATTVDVRSISRVGIGDLGANAARIREFLDRFRAAAG